MTSTIQMHALLARLEDRQLASEAREWTDRTFENDAAMSAALRPIQERLGDHLRALYANEPNWRARRPTTSQQAASDCSP